MNATTISAINGKSISTASTNIISVIQNRLRWRNARGRAGRVRVCGTPLPDMRSERLVEAQPPGRLRSQPPAQCALADDARLYRLCGVNQRIAGAAQQVRKFANQIARAEMGNCRVLPQMAAYHARGTAGDEIERAPARPNADYDRSFFEAARFSQSGQCAALCRRQILERAVILLAQGGPAGSIGSAGAAKPGTAAFLPIARSQSHLRPLAAIIAPDRHGASAFMRRTKSAGFLTSSAVPDSEIT